MFNLICNKKGMSLLEVMIAIVLTTVGILALLSLQPTSYSLASKSDHLGRAAGILVEQLDAIEALISNPCLNVTTGSARTVYVSGVSGQSGDIAYTVTPTITAIPSAISPSHWLVRVRVTWASNTTGISESRVVTRQEDFKTTKNCAIGSVQVTY